jgi:ATP-binding cassette, subfamily B, bacterial
MRQQDAQLLVLDEPTAALDPKMEHEVYAVLRTLAQGKMAVVISHRLALARLADRIVVLEHGQIVEEGNHQSLMAAQHQYYEMFTRQASSYAE